MALNPLFRQFAAICVALLLSGQNGAFTQPWLDSKGKTVDPFQRSSSSGLTLLTIWCAQCGSCRSAEKTLDTVHREFGKRVTVYAVDPNSFDTPTAIAQQIAKAKLTFPVLRDPKGQILKEYGIEKTTTTLLLDRQHKLLYFGPLEHAEPALREALAGKPVSRPSYPQRGCPIPVATSP